jgi:hypothetical protein
MNDARAILEQCRAAIGATLGEGAASALFMHGWDACRFEDVANDRKRREVDRADAIEDLLRSADAAAGAFLAALPDRPAAGDEGPTCVLSMTRPDGKVEPCGLPATVRADGLWYCTKHNVMKGGARDPQRCCERETITDIRGSKYVMTPCDQAATEVVAGRRYCRPHAEEFRKLLDELRGWPVESRPAAGAPAPVAGGAAQGLRVRAFLLQGQPRTIDEIVEAANVAIAGIADCNVRTVNFLQDGEKFYLLVNVTDGPECRGEAPP